MTDPDVKTKVLSKPHWRVVIRPTRAFYDEQRASLGDLLKIMVETHVQLRGWYYPYVRPENITVTGQSKISGHVDWQGECEYWEFFTSGQFAHVFAFNEDYYIDQEQEERIRQSTAFGNERSKGAKSFLEVFGAMAKVTEVYYFASRLAQTAQLQSVDEFEVKIELIGVKGRMLYVGDRLRSLWDAYICQIEDDKVTFSHIYRREELIGKFSSLALDIVNELYMYFGWKEPNMAQAAEDQKKLLERRL